MLGLFGTLNVATRSLSTQQQAAEVSGHNLANVNNPAYARQRLAITSANPIPSSMGPQGAGAESVAILQLRSELLDRQILSETSVLGSLESQQRALEYAQSNLGQVIDRHASGADGTAATGGVGGQHGIAEELSNLFNAFQSLSTNPTSSAERQVLLLKAENLATQFNQVAKRLDDVNRMLNQSVQAETDQANALIAEIAKLNSQILRIEVGGGVANDLRDRRQSSLEELSRLVNFTITETAGGAVDVTVDGVVMTAGASVLETLETYDAGGGQLLIRAAGAGTNITPTSGSLQGTIEARDGALATLRAEINTLASNLIASVNALHAAGHDLAGGTGEAFFTGTDASTIRVNATLMADPSRIQAAGVPGATGDNTIALKIAQLADAPITALGGETFSQSYGRTVAKLGQSLASVNSQIENQEIVSRMLTRHRDSISGVSLDEEMTDLIRFQKAFQASARLITMVDEMLDIVMSIKR
jgi:flagellar hook-associated protein 1 FlgK